MKTHQKLIEALKAYEAAFEDLFCQCLTNPIKNAWGKTVSLESLNVAHSQAHTLLNELQKLSVLEADGFDACLAMANAIHYPACWDTSAYPTLQSALHEMAGTFSCSNDECSVNAPKPASDSADALPVDSAFEREDHYLVIKHTDSAAALSETEREQLAGLVHKIDGWRRSQDKDILQAVVVERGWPEYEPTWRAVEARVKGAEQMRLSGMEEVPASLEGYARNLDAIESRADVRPEHKAAVDHAHEILRRLMYHRDGDFFVNVNRVGAEALHVSTISTIVNAALLTVEPENAVVPAPLRQLIAEVERRVELLKTCTDHKQFESAAAMVKDFDTWVKSMSDARAQAGM